MPPDAAGSVSVLAEPTVKVRSAWLTLALPKLGAVSALTMIRNVGALVAASESVSRAESVTFVEPKFAGVPLSIRVAGSRTRPGTAGEKE